jgi:hypothetical protein
MIILCDGCGKQVADITENLDELPRPLAVLLGEMVAAAESGPMWCEDCEDGEARNGP